MTLYVDKNTRPAPVPAVTRSTRGVTMDASVTTYVNLPEGELITITNLSTTSIRYAYSNSTTTPNDDEFAGVISPATHIDIAVEQAEDLAHIHFADAVAGDKIGIIYY